MVHALPAHPDTGIVPSIPLPTSLLSLDEPIAGPSRPTDCAICSNPPKYTCPRCSLRTCSLSCSTSHKTKFACSGKRDPTSFVPLKDVGQGVWADDYRYLEEGRRKVAAWGEGIPRAALEAEAGRGASRGRGGRGRGRGRGRGDMRGIGRMHGLGRELEKRGMRVQFMPEGMERRRKNQSSWNPKTQSLHLTIQLSVPSSLVDEPSTMERKLVTHARVALEGTNNRDLPTLASLFPSTTDLSTLVLVLPYHGPPDQAAATVSSGTQLYFPLLDMNTSVSTALRGTAFIEFPTIIVMQKAEWEAKSQKGVIRILPLLPIVTQDAGWSGKRKAQNDGPPDANAADKRARMIDLGLGLGEYKSEDEVEEADEEVGAVGASIEQSEGGITAVREDSESHQEGKEVSVAVLGAVQQDA